MRDIVVVGSLNVDISVQADHIPQPGETVRADGLGIGPGGKGLNQALAARRLGARVHMVGRVGEDRFAEVPERALQQAGVNANYVRRVPDHHTGTALVVVDASSGETAIAVAGGANHQLSPGDVQDAVAAFRASGVLMVQLELALDTVEAALDLARENALVTLLDPAPVLQLSDTLLRKVDILTPNASEAERLTRIRVRDPESAAEAGARLRERTGGDVLVTLGAAGCIWVWPTGFEHVSTPRVDALDTTGAGDAFNAGLAVGLARGEPIARALRTAVRAGAAATQRPGAANAMPTPDQLKALSD